jgi:hypothetical protein
VHNKNGCTRVYVIIGLVSYLPKVGGSVASFIVSLVLIYFIFQSGKNKIQMYKHKIKIQPNNVCINYCINKTWFSKSVSPNKRWVPQTKNLQIIVSYDKNSLILTSFTFPETSSSSEKQATGPGLLKDSPYSISLKVYIPIPRSCRNIFRLCRDDNKRCIFT